MSCPLPASFADVTYKVQGFSAAELACVSLPRAGRTSFEFDIGSCNVTRVRNGDRIEAKVVLEPLQMGVVPLHDVRGSPPMVNCTCSYPRDGYADTSPEMPSTTPRPRVDVAGQGDFTPSLRLCTDPNFTQCIADGGDWPADGRFYFLEGEAEGVHALGMLRCDASPESDLETEISVRLVADSCATTDWGFDQQILPAPRANIVWLSMRSFAFPGSATVIFTCTFQQCPAIPCASCGRQLAETEDQSLDQPPQSSIVVHIPGINVASGGDRPAPFILETGTTPTPRLIATASGASRQMGVLGLVVAFVQGLCKDIYL